LPPLQESTGSKIDNFMLNPALAIQNGLHHDPFSFLGIHEVKGKPRQWAIRVFKPGADGVVILAADGSELVQAVRMPETDVFEAHIPHTKAAPEYRVKALYASGANQISDDPYRFGTLIDPFDLHIWGEGNHGKAYLFMGAHLKTVGNVQGVHFVVWAPAASRVSVVGEFNGWDGRQHPMRKHHDQGLFELFIPGLQEGIAYKYEIKNPDHALPMLKSDPYGFYAEVRPRTASVIYDIEGYEWGDSEWVKTRTHANHFEKPLSVYEMHAGSWRRKGTGENDFLTYRDLADQLVPYVKELGFTHIELLPVAEHPYDPSWGYQITGYYAPTSRFGTPHDFMYFVDTCHQNGIGVIVDWVPAHFTKDDHGLRFFDGTHLYEHADPRQGEHKDWGTNIFNFGRNEVQNFLVSNAMFWVDKFHIDGLRVDAVASMLYLDYSRKEGEWIPNKYGGRENLEAISFLKKFNEVVHKHFPGVVTMAEESTAWPMVSKPTYVGGLGFDYKWNMGWMNDTLKYFENDPIYRRYHHGQLTFSLIYAFTENFMLPLSHDEVVHGKKSLAGKMPGDDWQKMANLRLLLSYMWAHPGKKLLFMGSEFGQWIEWNSTAALDWHALEFPNHRGMKRLVSDLNGVYKAHKPMHEVDFEWTGFEWIDFQDVDNSIISFVRYARGRDSHVVCAYNFTPVVHPGYFIGVPNSGSYKVLINTDRDIYGGSNVWEETVVAEPVPWHNQPNRIRISLPPLAGLILERVTS
jgi:1,4-alpha-glucan branching enzyme